MAGCSTAASCCWNRPNLTARRLPVDFFFRSLARDQREKKAIGIVLSGTGSDGTMGARAIKDEGGLVLAQDPGNSARSSTACRAARSATGLVDYVLAARGHARGFLMTLRRA